MIIMNYINETDLDDLVIGIRHGVQSCAHFNYHSQRHGIYSHANCVRHQYWYTSCDGLHDPRAPITRRGQFINMVVGQGIRDRLTA